MDICNTAGMLHEQCIAGSLQETRIEWRTENEAEVALLEAQSPPPPPPLSCALLHFEGTLINIAYVPSVRCVKHRKINTQTAVFSSIFILQPLECSSFTVTASDDL